MMMNKTCIMITIVPIVNGIPGMSDRTYGGADIGEEPRLARIDNDVPNAMMKRMKIKLR